MCKPGISKRSKTDAELVEWARHNLKAMTTTTEELSARGLQVAFLNHLGYATSCPTSIRVTREVSL